jgi:glycosyltransferase involved in cell wall biosynthesis
LKIGIDIRALSKCNTGIGRYLDKLLGALLTIDNENEYILFHNAFKGLRPNRLFGNGNANIVSSRWPNRMLSYLWSRTSWPSIEYLIGPVDVFHAPAYQMPPVRRGLAVLTVHDLVFMIHPEMASPEAVMELGPWIKRYAERADIIVADSNATASDIEKYLGIPSGKIKTVYPGANIFPKLIDDEIWRVKRELGINGDFILSVGNLEPRKNLARLFRAFERSGLARDFELVLVGPKGWHYGEIFETWQSLPCNNRIHWLSYVSEEILSALYSGASFLVYPSIMEGFGFPILEAMSAGCPVVTSNISSMPEVAGNAAVYVEAFDIDSIADGMKQLASDSRLRMSLAKAGHDRVAKFSWENTARQMMEIYGMAVGKGGNRSQPNNGAGHTGQIPL